MMRCLKTGRWALVMLSLAAVLSLAPQPAQACPNCKSMMRVDETDPVRRAQQEQQANLGRGMSYSVIFMLAVPYLLLGSFGGAVWWTMRRGRPA